MTGPRRDFIGYGRDKPSFLWPDGKRLALSIVVNYEEGSEHSQAVDRIVEGMGEFLPIDIRARDVGNESVYEYGPRVAIWRVLETLAKFKTKATFFATAEALRVNTRAAKAIVEGGHEICDHGLRWTEHYRYTASAGEEGDQALRGAHRRGDREKARRVLRQGAQHQHRRDSPGARELHLRLRLLQRRLAIQVRGRRHPDSALHARRERLLLHVADQQVRDLDRLLSPISRTRWTSSAGRRRRPRR